MEDKLLRKRPSIQDAVMDGITDDIILSNKITGLQKRLAMLGFKYDATKDGAFLTWVNTQKTTADDTTKAILTSISMTVVDSILTF